MAATIVTIEDLEQFKVELLDEFKNLLEATNQTPPPKEEKVWLKSHQVQRLLGISPGTLQTLRINGTIPYSKIGGVLFYSKVEIEGILENNMRNNFTNGRA